MRTEKRCTQHPEHKFPHKPWDDEKGDFGKKNCKGPGKDMDLPYEDMTWEELAGKIDYEGGVAEFFTGYASPVGMNDEHLRALAYTLKGAYEEMRAYLEEKGGVL